MNNACISVGNPGNGIVFRCMGRKRPFRYIRSPCSVCSVLTLHSASFAITAVNYLGCGLVSMAEFIASTDAEKLQKLERNKELMIGIPVEEIQLLSPIVHPKQDVICLGINYYAHAEEAARFHDEAFGGERPQPIYFSKRVNRAVGHGEPGI